MSVPDTRTKWEYCEVREIVKVFGKDMDGKIEQGGFLSFLGPSSKQAKSERLAESEVKHKLAQLGIDGWELVSHTLVWGLLEATPVPLFEVYYLKRQIEKI